MGELVNLVGLSIGVVLYAMLLAMVVGAGRAPDAQSRFDPLLLVTSILGLVWNLCALPAYELPKVGIEGPFPFWRWVSCALGFLRRWSSIRCCVAGRRGARCAEAIIPRSPTPSRCRGGASSGVGVTGGPCRPRWVWLLTYTFVALVVPLAAVTRGQPGARRAMWAAALATFAVSALHLSQFHQGEASWPVELVGHHASLPLAFAILYQDYPFALAVLFLKRALALLSHVTLAFIAIVAFGLWSTEFSALVRADPRQIGVLVTLWVAVALLYPALRRVTAWFVDTIVLRRPDYRWLRTTVARSVQTHEDIGALLVDVCERLAPARSASLVSWREVHGAADDQLAGSVVVPGARAGGRLRAASASARRMRRRSTLLSLAAVVFVPVSEAPRYAILISELTGGRRCCPTMSEHSRRRCRGRQTDRRDPDHAESVRTRASRAGDPKACDRSGARAARPDQSAFPSTR
jgi:hypothetical protein